MEKRVLVVGSIFTDFIMHVDRVPLAGEVTEEYGPRETVTGGAGLNAAAAFARLGADTLLCAKVGEDAPGAALLRAAANFGIDTRFSVKEARGRSGFNAVIAESNGIRRTACYPGCAYDISGSEAEEALTCYPDGLFLSMELPAKTIIHAADIAEEGGVPVFLNGCPADPHFPFDRLPKLEAFICNAEQAASYTKIQPDTLENCLRAAIKLSTIADAKYYIIKLADRGCYLYDGTYQHLCPGETVESTDARGAGDVFNAAAVLGYLEEGDMESACKYANIAAAVAMTKAGHCASFPTNEEIAAYLRTHENDE